MEIVELADYQYTFVIETDIRLSKGQHFVIMTEAPVITELTRTSVNAVVIDQVEEGEELTIR